MYTDDGLERPVLLELAAPGPGHVVRVVNTAPVEFSLTVAAVPCGVMSTCAAAAPSRCAPL